MRRGADSPENRSVARAVRKSPLKGEVSAKRTEGFTNAGHCLPYPLWGISSSFPTAKNLEALVYGRQIRVAGASSWPPALPAGSKWNRALPGGSKWVQVLPAPAKGVSYT